MGYDPSIHFTKEFSQLYFDEVLRMATISNQLTYFGTHAGMLSASDYLDTKHQVTGMWNAILNICFPTQEMHYLIDTEHECQRLSQKTDLFVSFMDTSYRPWPRLAFEAKGTRAATWENIQKQMLNFLAQKIGSSPGQACWAVAARGNEVKFWRYTSRFVGAQRMVPVFVMNGAVMDGNDYVGMTMDPYAIGPSNYPTDWPSIQLILEHMAGNVAIS